MMKLSILKVEDPSCLWCRVMGAPGSDVATAEQYNSLLAQMNLFYNDVTQDLRKMKPTALEKGQVCVVYWSFVKSWCRAVVESVIMDSVSCKARCLLVDHGERLIITLDKIRVAMQDFLQLPFWVKRFQLAGIKPITLRVSVLEKAQLIPSTRWDSSATLYLHNLLQASTWTEAVLLESESDSTSIQLYLTLGNIKICVNDELVAKKFAYYKSKDPAEISTLDEMDSLPVMLSSTILAQIVSLSSNKATAQTQAAQVMSQGQVEGSAAGWLMVSSPLQNQLKTLEADNRSEVTEEPASRSSISESAAAESHSSDNTDSSLAAALTRKLSLFKSLKLMNPDSSDQRVAHAVGQHKELSNHRPEESNTAGSACAQQEVSTFLLNGESAAPVEDELHASNGRNGAEGLNIRQVECQMCEDKSSDTSVESGPAEAVKARRTKGDRACLRLLGWLNPKALNPDPDAADVRVVPFDDARRSEVLVHSAFPVEPCSSLDDAPITDTLRSVLQRRQYGALSAADRYSWPAVARGCNTVIISSGGKQPFGYIFPLLTHILLNSISCCTASSKGPIAVLLCPGWEKVQVLYETLDKSRIAQTLHPLSVLTGAGKDNFKIFRIPQNCLLMLTTPFSLVRLLSTQCFMFLRLCHLVLHEADQLLTHAPDQMAIILQHFQKVTSSKENANSPQQLVAMAERWTSDMEDLVTSHMPCPCIILTVPVEAALYGNVQQVVLTTPESSKISELLGTLDLNPNVSQKTLIVAKCAQEVEDVFKAVSNTSAFCLKIHEGLTEQLDLVVKQWRRDIGHGTHVILVTTTECLQCFGITDATCVVHYSFPASPKDFGKRLFCLSDNFRNLSEQVSSPDQIENHPHVARSVLLISEKNARHAVGVLRYLERTDARTPPELQSFAQGILEAWETQKTSRPLCRLLKSFGVCRHSGSCPDRHRFISCLDQSELPDSGVIEVVPLHVKTASVFYGRIIRKEDGRFNDLVSEMASYYADKTPGATEMSEGGLYAVEEEDVFHRVRIISIPDRGSQLFFRLLVHFIDVGKEEEVKSHQILHLPERFHSLPGQAVELIVCRVKPADAEVDWHPKVTRTISQKIRGLQHRARVVLSLGNTVFVDPMVRVTQMPSLKTVINEYNVQSEILNSGMGVKNLEHVDLLRELCREGRASSSTEAGFSPGSDGVLEEDVLSEVFRAAQVKKLADLPQLEAIPSLSPSIVPGPGPAHGLLVPACDQKSMSAIQTETEQRNACDMKSAVTKSGCSGEETAVNNSAPGDDQSSRQQNLATDDTVKSLHPQLRWYQTSGSVIITVKLLSPESQSCDFYCDRVVYRGRVSGQSYRAELELQGAVNADCCFWKMKSNQPVLTLVKQQQGFWEKLLRNKNHFVRYDMEHLDEDEDSAPHGVWFVENTGEEIYYMSSESDSD